MRIIPFYHTSFDLCSNTFLLIDDSNNCVVIDPSTVDDGVINTLKNNHLNLKGILLTHGHFDHIRGVKHLLDAFKVNVYIHSNDVPLLTNPSLNCSDRFSRENITLKTKSITISDGQEVGLLEEKIKVIHTPFHTMGSVCFYLPDAKALISGDTLFQYSIGRVDLATSNPSLVGSSLKKIMSLPDDTRVYAGHGPETTIGTERKLNSFVS